MSGQKAVILSGVGGQGLIVCGTLLGEAAVLYDGKKAVLSSEYGVETRGTFTKSDIIVSDSEIFYPEAISPVLVLCLHQVAYDRYDGKLAEGCALVYDSDRVAASEGPNQSGYPLTELARGLGGMSTLNIIALGLVTAKTGIVSPDAVRRELAAYWGRKGEKVVAVNLKAFETGLSLA